LGEEVLIMKRKKQRHLVEKLTPEHIAFVCIKGGKCGFFIEIPLCCFCGKAYPVMKRKENYLVKGKCPGRQMGVPTVDVAG